MEMDTDPLEGSSYDLGVTVKAEIKEEDEDDHYNTIRKVSRVSWHQLEVLCDFLNSNRAIATAHNRALPNKEHSQRKWREVTKSLNSQRDGGHKDWAGWKKFWIDYKAKLKKRVIAVRASQLGTVGGPTQYLTEIEEKFLRILGKDFGKRLPGARVEPPPKIVAAAIDEDVQDSQSPEPVLDPPSPTAIPPVNKAPQSPLEPMLQDPPTRSPSSSPPRSPRAAPPAPRAPAGSPRRRGPRRGPSMSQAAARRALVRSSQMHADAALRTAEAMEKTVLILDGFQKTAMRIERILNAAFSTVVEQEDSE